VIGYVEPKPGIPPTTSHTVELIEEMKKTRDKGHRGGAYFDLKTPKADYPAGRRRGTVLAPSVGGSKEATDYIGLFDYDVNMMIAALKRTAGK
jgi:hypothetical protein